MQPASGMRCLARRCCGARTVQRTHTQHSPQPQKKKEEGGKKDAKLGLARQGAEKGGTQLCWRQLQCRKLREG